MSTKLSKVIDELEDKIAELNRTRTIPYRYREFLEERLKLTFGPIRRLDRRTERRDSKESRVQHSRKKAQAVYSAILDETPQIYLPFILVVSPRFCESFKIASFLETYNQRNQQLGLVRLGADAKIIFGEISAKANLDQNYLYKNLLRTLFPSAPRPISACESAEKFTFSVVDTNSLRVNFGDPTYDGVERAPARIQEKENRMLQSTQCVRVDFAQRELKDCVFHCDIGGAKAIAQILFPHVVDLLPKEHLDGNTLDNAFFFLKGASISGIISMYSPRVCEAIDSSELRVWEKECHLLDTTDCVTMKISRSEPRWGTISVRVGYSKGFPILTELCK